MFFLDKILVNLQFNLMCISKKNKCMVWFVGLLSLRNKILTMNRQTRNNPQIKIDNAENSLFPKKNEMNNDK